MARAAAASSRNGKDDIKIDEQVAKIRKDIADLAGAFGDAGYAKADELTASANAKRDELTRKSVETVEELRRQLNTIEDRIEGRVRERPFAALGIAAAFGFVVAMLARR